MTLPYIAVIGGSYVGVKAAQELAAAFAGRFRVLLVEKNSHFQHLFAFPRFAVATGVETNKAFIPYIPGTFAACPPGSGSVIQARVTKLDAKSIQLDRKVSLDGQLSNEIRYSYLVIATGTKLTPPSTLPGSEKMDGVLYLQKHVQKVKRASSIAVIGGGAVGVQTATDIKELYPEKSVTLIHSRQHLMNKFHPAFHQLIAARCQELGVNMQLGSRVRLPSEGFPIDGSQFDIELENDSRVPTEFAIIATGQTPQSSLLEELSPQSIDASSFIKTLKTLQIADPALPNIFAVGDVAATGAHKAARPGFKQAALVAQNIEHLILGQPLDTYDITDPPAIHLTLGVTNSVVFRDPAPGSTEPEIKAKYDGRIDMGIDGVWTRRGGGANALL